MNLTSEFDGEDVAVQLDVVGHTLVIDVEPQVIWNLSRLLGDLLGVVGDAVSGAEIVAVFEQPPHLVDVVGPMIE